MKYNDYKYEINDDGTVTITGYNMPIDEDEDIDPYRGTTIISIPTVIDGKAVSTIGNRAFENCWFFQSVTIPDSVTSIGYSAFYNCRSLTSINIPDNVKFIDESAFWYCDDLTIHCSQGSYAKKYAKKNNVYYKITD